MVPLHLFMSIYKLETMLASSHCVFHHGSRQNWLIFDPKGFSAPHNCVCLHMLTACCDFQPTQTMIPLHLFMSIYNLQNMLDSCWFFYYGNRQNGLVVDPKRPVFLIQKYITWHCISYPQISYWTLYFLFKNTNSWVCTNRPSMSWLNNGCISYSQIHHLTLYFLSTNILLDIVFHIQKYIFLVSVYQ